MIVKFINLFVLFIIFNVILIECNTAYFTHELAHHRQHGSTKRRLTRGMPNVCQRRVVHFRRDWKVCRKSKPGPEFTMKIGNCTESEEEVDNVGNASCIQKAHK